MLGSCALHTLRNLVLYPVILSQGIPERRAAAFEIVLLATIRSVVLNLEPYLQCDRNTDANQAGSYASPQTWDVSARKSANCTNRR